MKKYKKFLACIALIGCMQECRAEYAFASSGSAITGSSMATIASGKKGWAFAANLMSPDIINPIIALIGLTTFMYKQNQNINYKLNYKRGNLVDQIDFDVVLNSQKNLDLLRKYEGDLKEIDPFYKKRCKLIEKELKDAQALIRQYPWMVIDRYVDLSFLISLVPFCCQIFNDPVSHKQMKAAGACALLAAGLQIYNTWNYKKVVKDMLIMKHERGLLCNNVTSYIKSKFNWIAANEQLVDRRYYPGQMDNEDNYNMEQLHNQYGFVEASPVLNCKYDKYAYLVTRDVCDSSQCSVDYTTKGPSLTDSMVFTDNKEKWSKVCKGFNRNTKEWEYVPVIETAAA